MADTALTTPYVGGNYKQVRTMPPQNVQLGTGVMHFHGPLQELIIWDAAHDLAQINRLTNDYYGVY